MNFKLLYPDFKLKAMTLSYDDGIIQDKELIKRMNKWGLKGTFNLNSGKQGDEKYREDIYGTQIDCSHLDLRENKNIYKGHEIASHTRSHPFLERLTKEEQEAEFTSDIAELKAIFNQEIRGSAYPFGTYDSSTLEVLDKVGIKYARTVKSTYSFLRPFNFLLWHPTIHHRDPLLMEYVDKFINEKDMELPLLYIWGHAYEFAIDHNFDLIDEVGKKVSSQKDIYFATNIEIYDYIKAAELVYYKKREEGFLINPSSKTIYLVTEKGDYISLEPKRRLKYE